MRKIFRPSMLEQIFCLTVLVLITSCAPPAITTTMLVPAKYHEAAKLKEVAVLPFDGKNGDEFAKEIEGILASINIGDKQYFTLFERAKLEKIIDEELKLSQAGFTDPKTVVKVGKAIGAKGVYTGVVAEPRIENSGYAEKRTKCAYEETYTDNKGKQRTRCGRWDEYTVPCTKRTVVFAFTPKLIEVETGKIVYSANLQDSSDASACSDSGRSLTSESELIDEAKKMTTHLFRTQIAPHYITIDIKLMDSTDGITTDEGKAKLKSGIDFAKNNRLDRACELWGEARTMSTASPSLLYNLGVCSETTGDSEQALDLYKKADKLLLKPDDRVTVALNRVNQRIMNQKKLQEQTK